MMAHGRQSAKIGIGETAIHHNIRALPAVAAYFAREEWNSCHGEITRRYPSVIGRDLSFRIALSFRDGELARILPGRSGESYRRSRGPDARQCPQRVQRPADARGKPVRVGGFSVASGHMKSEDMRGIEARRN